MALAVPPHDAAVMLVGMISESIRSLYRLGSLIRNSSQPDRFERAILHSEVWSPIPDIQHVKTKHTKLEDYHQGLAERLGGAIAKRRQVIQYNRNHRKRLDPQNEESIPEYTSTKASTYNPANLVFEESHRETDHDVDDMVSQGTTSTMHKSKSELHLPKLAELSDEGEYFECPICFVLQSSSTEEAWRSVR